MKLFRFPKSLIKKMDAQFDESARHPIEYHTGDKLKRGHVVLHTCETPDCIANGQRVILLAPVLRGEAMVRVMAEIPGISGKEKDRIVKVETLSALP